MYRWVNVFGTAMAAYLDEHGMPGAMHRGRFDDWYPGFVDHVNNFRNTVCVPHRDRALPLRHAALLHRRRFPARQAGPARRGASIPAPGRAAGGAWPMPCATCCGASMAVLDTAAKNREELLYDRYRAGHDVIERFTKDPPYAYVIPREQRDTPTAALLVEKLLIEWHRSAPGHPRVHRQRRHI